MTNVLHLIGKELCGRKLSFLLSAIAVAAAVALYTLLTLTEEASQRETVRVMRDMGFNLRVIPRSTDMEHFYLTGFSDQTFPESSIDALSKVGNLSYNHLVAVLQGHVDLDGRKTLLMGISGEQAAPGNKKAPMVEPIASGDVHIGSEIAERFGLQKGSPFDLQGRTFHVARVMPETGSLDDLRLIASLADVQSTLDLNGQINEIKAIDCLCLTPAENPRDIIQAEIERTLPDARVVMLSQIAEARARQRQTSGRNAQLVIASVILAAAAWVAILAVVNVRQRASEIGLLRALGYGSGTIAALVLGRAGVIGLVAAIVGSLVGTWGATTYGPAIFELTAKAIEPQPQLFWHTLWITPLFAAAASLIPAALAVVQDPANVLRRQ